EAIRALRRTSYLQHLVPPDPAIDAFRHVGLVRTEMLIRLRRAVLRAMHQAHVVSGMGQSAQAAEGKRSSASSAVRRKRPVLGQKQDREGHAMSMPRETLSNTM